MKRYILPAAIAALSMLSCQKELADPAQPDQAPAPGELTEMTFSATVEENDTKTYIDATDHSLQCRLSFSSSSSV